MPYIGVAPYRCGQGVALYRYGPIQVWPYIDMALYSVAALRQLVVLMLTNRFVVALYT